VLGQTAGDFEERLVGGRDEQHPACLIADEYARGDVLARQPSGDTGVELDLGVAFVPQVVREDRAVAAVVRLLVAQGPSLGRSAATVSPSSRTGRSCRWPSSWPSKSRTMRCERFDPAAAAASAAMVP